MLSLVPPCASTRADYPRVHWQVYGAGYGFLAPGVGGQRAVPISHCRGHTMRWVVPQKGPTYDSTNTLNRFALEAGRTADKLHRDGGHQLNPYSTPLPAQS